MPLIIGKVYDRRYKIVQPIQEGGEGTVYLAYDKKLKNHPVAIKECNLASPQERKNLEKEALILIDFDNENVPRVFGIFETANKSTCLVMDYIEGDNLEQKRLKDNLNDGEIVNWLSQIADTLSQLHGKHIVHGDIKPKNIIISSKEPWKAYLVDFGSAKIYQPGRVPGEPVEHFSPGYTSPEQFQGRLDIRSDIYALGATLFTLLSGKIFNPSVTIKLTGTASKYFTVVSTSVMLSPDDRYQTARNFREALQAAQYAPAIADEATAEPRVDKEEYRSELRNTIFQPISALSARLPSWSKFLIAILATVALSWICLLSVFLAWNLIQRANMSYAVTQTILALSSSRISATSATPESITPSIYPISTPVHLPSATKSDTPVDTSSSAATRTAVERRLMSTEAKLTEAAGSETSAPMTSTASAKLTNNSGNLIAFHSDRAGNNDIYVMNTDGNNVARLTSWNSDDRAPSWSPDGSELAFQSNEDGDFEIYTINLNSQRIQQITTNDCDDFSPVWSPNGEYFVFYSNCDGNREIYLIDQDGSGRKQLTFTIDAYNWFPSWSPDSSHITYSTNISGRYKINVMDMDGSNSYPVADGCASWYSPDGRLILFAQYCTDSGNILVVGIDGSDLRTLTQSPFDSNRNPSWSPDGSKILFQSEQTGNSEIWVMNFDGSGVIQLTFNPALDAVPMWQPLQQP